jgi:DNA-binding MarR family transcriptional regulator
MSGHGGRSSEVSRALSGRDYQQLAELRYGLRSFTHWSELQAKEAGITAPQYQLLLAVRATDGERGPTIGAVADWLLTRHHSAVELCDRAADAGLVVRTRDPEHPSVVRLSLTEHGEELLETLAEHHRDEIARRAPGMCAMWTAVQRTASAAAR